MDLAPAASLTLFLSLLFPLAASHNITKMLAQLPDFSTFSDLLTQTHLAADINSRSTVTILAVSNGAMSSVSDEPIDTIKKILSLHVILDYYDDNKIHKISNHSAILTTLFQASGDAAGQNGFLNVTDMDNGQIAFGSAVAGSSLTANFVKVLATQPYNISVLQISSVIVPANLSGGASSNHSTKPPGSSPTPTAAPKTAPAPPTAAPSEAPSEAASPRASVAKSPSGKTDDAPGPSDAPASAGIDGSPAGAPSDDADGPEGDGGGNSAADRVVAGVGLAVASGFAMLGAL
ncbi:Fasciclin-like arabinogalactan [Musa troglodytarum]|uniref:Fasciclin-like arabinogalactan n=1 Tax=Musa troglodytarum TaxID=320322 RepID=A0A9E7JWE6_9LILI|nr:Fasciclin-like arabinogalactan [Musa troglodytarum]